MSPKVIEMLLNAKKDRDKERSVKCDDYRACSSGCGAMVKLSDLSASAIRYRKFSCPTCESIRKSKYKVKS